MSEDFQKQIQDWVSVDNKMKHLQFQVKELRQKKNSLTNSIFDYAESNNLENAIVKISDGKLKFQNVKSTSPLTWGLVEECLNDVMSNEDQVKSIIKYIKSKRETKYNHDIKRSYSQTT